MGVGRTTSIYNLDLHDGPFDAHGLSFIRPISPEHIYAKCCFRPLECLVKQCTVPAVLELIFCLKRWSKPINEKPHNTHHTEIRIQKIKDCKGLEQGFSSLAFLICRADELCIVGTVPSTVGCLTASPASTH